MPFIDVDIDIDDFYYELSHREKLEIVELLKEDGILEERNVVVYNEYTDPVQQGTPIDFEWAEMIDKLNSARYQLTEEQESILRNLVNQI